MCSQVRVTIKRIAFRPGCRGRVGSVPLRHRVPVTALFPKRFRRILGADWMQRRTGIVTALTSDVDAMYAAADPERENLCLYGNPDGSWQV